MAKAKSTRTAKEPEASDDTTSVLAPTEPPPKLDAPAIVDEEMKALRVKDRPKMASDHGWLCDRDVLEAMHRLAGRLTD